MLKKAIFAVSVSLCCASLLLCTTGCAAFRKGSRARVNTLLVTGNYLQPRMICELTQDRTHQPVLLFNPAEGNEEAVFFYLSPNHGVERIEVSQFDEFVDYLNPRVVIFLGDNTYYPEEIVSERLRKDYSVMVLSSSDWGKNALMVGNHLGLGDIIYKHYVEYYNLYQAAPDKAAELPER